MKQIEKHKEVIKKLEILKKGWYQLSDPIKAIDYAINQLEQAQVFDEPVEMEVRDADSRKYQKEIIHGYFKGQWLQKDIDDDEYFISFKEARPIEEKPLEFGSWMIEQYGGIVPDEIMINSIHKEWEQYLDNFNKQNK